LVNIFVGYLHLDNAAVKSAPSATQKAWI
jgi:hypothetical protein